ncbi:hypothetical protein [Rhizobium sullae]|nr:hypothetical protein [Rhizobium sullae]
MSIRDYAAIKAMASLVNVTGSQDNVFGYLLGTVGGDPSDKLAELAYGLADAMIAARKKEA